MLSYGLLAVGVCGLVVLLAKLVRAGGQVEAVMRRDEQAARARDATVLGIYRHETSRASWTSNPRRDVHVRVHLPDGEDYTACNTWVVTGAAKLYEVTDHDEPQRDRMP